MTKYIYESPDKGITIYRREFGDNGNRVLVGNQSQEPIGDKKVAVVFGGGGFIGAHLVKRLKKDGYWVRVVDLKLPPYAPTFADDYIIGDLRKDDVVVDALTLGSGVSNVYANTAIPYQVFVDELYQLAADMGGAGFVFSGDHDADIMHNSALINLNTVDACVRRGVKKVFYSSSACMYPEHNQLEPDNPNCSEDSAYPANPDSEYGWEKLFSERLYLAYQRNYGLDVRIARFHNIFGPEGTWDGGREKAPAAMCRKVAEGLWNPSLRVGDVPIIEVWGDGEQTRSFLYIDECLEAVRRLMQSEFIGPVNIGSDEMISINGLIELISDISDNIVDRVHIDGPLGVRGRNSDNRLIEEKLGWKPSLPLRDGITKTYEWVSKQVDARARGEAVVL